MAQPREGSLDVGFYLNRIPFPLPPRLRTCVPAGYGGGRGAALRFLVPRTHSSLQRTSIALQQCPNTAITVIRTQSIVFSLADPCHTCSDGMPLSLRGSASHGLDRTFEGGERQTTIDRKSPHLRSRSFLSCNVPLREDSMPLALDRSSPLMWSRSIP
jgi:hypothetical protein